MSISADTVSRPVRPCGKHTGCNDPDHRLGSFHFTVPSPADMSEPYVGQVADIDAIAVAGAYLDAFNALPAGAEKALTLTLDDGAAIAPSFYRQPAMLKQWRIAGTAITPITVSYSKRRTSANVCSRGQPTSGSSVQRQRPALSVVHLTAVRLWNYHYSGLQTLQGTRTGPSPTRPARP